LQIANCKFEIERRALECDDSSSLSCSIRSQQIPSGDPVAPGPHSKVGSRNFQFAIFNLQFAIILLCGPVAVQPLAGEEPPQSSVAAAVSTEVQFYDRLHQTFMLLNQVAIPAYMEHFRDEPEKLAVVSYYAERLTEAHKQDMPRRVRPEINEKGKAAGDNTPLHVWMQAALGEARGNNVEILEHHLGVLGARPHAVLQRTDEADVSATTARCVLFDPELLWAHRRLWELKTGGRVPVDPDRVLDSLVDRQAGVRALREQPENSELSLRRFLDKHRRLVWELGWLYRCFGVEQERAGDLSQARESYLRAWAIGDALFPVSERGRLDRFDRVFLAELGDVYARIGRYDLMLRYIYSDQGLPAQFEMAKPIAELARVAESVRLARHDESAVEQLDEVLPETVSQILFEQPVMPAAPEAEKSIADSSNWAIRAGWVLIGVGGVVLLVAVASRLIRANRRTPLNRTNKAVSPLMNSPD
jgi:hypothetical protein